jgi:hypothetical protein
LTAIGSQALYANTTGAESVAVGRLALRFNTTGGSSVAVGHEALYSNTTASQNTAVGYQAGYSTTISSNNTSLGYKALYANTIGSASTAIGTQALQNSTSADYNTAVGYQAGYPVTTGTNNVLIGYSSGSSSSVDLTTGSNNILIGGNRPSTSAAAGAHQIVLATAANISGKGDNTAFISANGGSTYNGANTTTFATTSDQRIKKNIVDVTDALSKVTSLRPVEFDYKENDKHETGFIAQEYETVFPEQIIHHAASPAEKEWVGEDEVMAIQQNLVPYLVAAIKELKSEVDSLKTQLKGA